MDGYTLYISRCSGGDGVEESFKAKIKRREDALDAFAVAEAYCKGIGMVSRCEREGFDGFITMQPKDTEERRRAIDRVNRAYADEDYDRYERLIERYCHRFGFDGDYGLFEDACTDARIFGHGIG